MFWRTGFACIAHFQVWSTNHTLRIKSITPQTLETKTRLNLEHLLKTLQWMEETHLRLKLFRMGSSLVPYMSHPEYGPDYWDMYSVLLEYFPKIQEFIKKGFRLSFHPGQYTVLNSPHPHVVHNAIREIQYNTQVLDIFGCPLGSKIVIHLGGVYGNKEAAFSRLVKTLLTITPATRNRIVLENDDKTWTIKDALRASRETGTLPLFDYHHWICNPSEGILDDLAKVQEMWAKENQIPKVHLSTPRPGKNKRAHADTLCESVYPELDIFRGFSKIDFMIEAKSKDIAAMDFIRRFTSLRPGDK